jgi:cell division protein FtsB
MRTAAPSPAVAAVRPTRAPSTAAARRRRARLTARALVVSAIVGAVLVLSIAPARMYFEQKAELAQMQRRAERLEAQTDALAARAEQLRDPETLERLARRCLGMVRPGETAFVVVPKEGAPVPPPEC